MVHRLTQPKPARTWLCVSLQLFGKAGMSVESLIQPLVKEFDWQTYRVVLTKSRTPINTEESSAVLDGREIDIEEVGGTTVQSHAKIRMPSMRTPRTLAQHQVTEIEQSARTYVSWFSQRHTSLWHNDSFEPNNALAQFVPSTHVSPVFYVRFLHASAVMRRKIVDDLLSTEKIYLETLQKVITTYAEPLRYCTVHCLITVLLPPFSVFLSALSAIS